jgi:hypothetical protein
MLFRPQPGIQSQHSVVSGSVGVNYAHRGTGLGIFHNHGSEHLIELKKMINQRLGSSAGINGNYQLVSGENTPSRLKIKPN